VVIALQISVSYQDGGDLQPLMNKGVQQMDNLWFSGAQRWPLM
jgi:hypothetical protein